MRFFILFSLFSTLAFAQSTRDKTITIAKQKPALVKQLNDPKGFYATVFSQDKELNTKEYISSQNFGAYDLRLSDSIITLNNSYPDYISELELHYNYPIIKIKDIKDDKGNIKHNVYITSKISASQFITERGKGIIYERPIYLRVTSNLNVAMDNVTRYDYSNKVDTKASTLVIKNTTPYNLSQITSLDNKGNRIISQEYVDKVNKVQIHKLKRNAVNFLSKAFKVIDIEENYYFYYLKKWKENDKKVENYNTILKDFESAIVVKNYSKAKASIAKWEEFNSTLDKKERKQRNLYLYTLSNIAKGYYMANNFDKSLTAIKELQAGRKDKNFLIGIEREIKNKKSTKNDKVLHKPLYPQLKITKYYETKSINRVDKINSFINKYVDGFIDINTVYELTKTPYNNNTPIYQSKKTYYAIKNIYVPKFYSKENKGSKDKFKEYNTFMKGLNIQTPERDFFSKYSFKDINTSIIKPDINLLKETYHLTDLESNLFSSLMKRYVMLILARETNPDTDLSKFEIENDELRKLIEDHIHIEKKDKELTTEVLLSLKLIKTIENAKTISSTEFENALQNIKSYCKYLSI
ncbi:MAG: hypothetical protein ABJD66_04820 [Cellulophaga sp.]|uniref:hypothetical protein n=1 Tax=Cellulophaga sp. TaxID=1972202 RepID=UPI0032674BD4